jgi:type II secretory pathway pseudopilin PulG
MDYLANGNGAVPDRALTVVLAITAGLMALIAAGVYLEVADRQSSLKVALAIEEVRNVTRQARSYVRANGAFPTNAELGLPKTNATKSYSDVFSQPDVLRYSIAIDEGTITLQFGTDQGSLAGRSIRYYPVFTPEKVRWMCSSTVPAKYLPPKCRH